MLRLNRLGWLALGLMLFVSACSAPGGDPPSAAGQKSPTSTETVRTEAQVRSDVAGPGESTPTEKVPLEMPAETEAGPAESPTAGPVATPTEAEMPPTETPAATSAPQTEEAAPNEANGDPGPSEEQLRLLASLETLGVAPELYSEVWLNSEPLTLADLRGKVVMVEFWTFG